MCCRVVVGVVVVVGGHSPYRLACRLPFLGSVMTKDWVHGVGHSPVCQTLLQIIVRAVITSSPPAWTCSAGML